jgi:hypothetical protein
MGEGIIRVSKSAFGKQPIPVTLQDWHKWLFLPADYRIVDLAADDSVYKLSVVSDAIRNDVATLPDVTPVYSHDVYNGKITLERIEIRYIEEEIT